MSKAGRGALPDNNILRRYRDWFREDPVSRVALVVAAVSTFATAIATVSYGNYYTPSLQISNGYEIVITPNSYSVGDRIVFPIPVYANSGSSHKPATFSYELYHDEKLINASQIVIFPEHPRLFSIMVNTTTENPGREYFRIVFEFVGKNDEPFYKVPDDTDFEFIGEIFGSIEVRERRT